MDFMFDWEAEGDRFSFEDSDRFEEDSLCSWISEPESLCNNWRGWRKNNGAQQGQGQSHSGNREGRVTSLVELGSQAVAQYIPFEVVEHFYPPIPEQLQLRIAFWSFPENEEDIRLYSCLANGSADDFHRGEHLFNTNAVKDVLQIGFHLSGTVTPAAQSYNQSKGSFNVAVVFDRRRITSCTCTCNGTASWCAHVVALCLYRILQAPNVCLRAPVSESLSRLHRDQLQKFAQYLISELPQQILPTAQRLLDELLSSQKNAINTVCGAPDPTAGPSASEQTSWCLDETTLHENIKKTLLKFCVPSPIVFSDVNYLSSTAPPAAAEWQSLLRPLRGREPEGMWNLLSIIRELFRRRDSNAIPLLEILTDEVLSCEQLLLWWFNTKISAAHNSSSGHSSNRNSNNGTSPSQHAASSLCDEIVSLWRLSALNPSLSPMQRDDLLMMVKDWHIVIIDKVRKAKNNAIPNGGIAVKKSDVEVFPGFKPSIEACQMDWSTYKIPGITYVERAWRPACMAPDIDSRKLKSRNLSGDHGPRGLKGSENGRKTLTQVNSTDTQTDGGLSSSSEGFCENYKEFKGDPSASRHDSDSSFTEDIANDEEDIKQPKKVEKILINKTESGQKSNCSVVVSVSKEMNGSLVATAASIGPAASASIPASVETITCEGAGVLLSVSGEPVPVPVIVANGISPKKRHPLLLHGDNSYSESQQSSDEYQLYYYDPKAKLVTDGTEKKKKNDEPNYFAGIKKMDNKVEMLFARAEALHAHGHTREACRLAQQLAEEMIANPPDLITEPPPTTGKSKKKKHQNNTSSFASTTLAKAAFLCNVLLEDSECHHLAFKVGMFGLEMPRQPASSKALEVKLANQESELAALLKKIPLGLAELNVIRERAEQLRDGKLRSRGESLLPLTLASFIFDSLCLPANPVTSSNSRPPSRCVQISARLTTDERLGFEAAVAALGLKANISEADHPLLCEGTRRQRGDLAIAMLFHYKDDQPKLAKIMDKVLDPEIHQLFKAQSINLIRSYMMGARPPAQDGHHHSSHTTTAATVSIETGVRKEHKVEPMSHKSEMSKPSEMHHMTSAEMATCQNTGMNWQTVTVTSGVQNLEYLNLEQKFAQLTTRSPSSGARPKATTVVYSNRDTDSSALEEDGEGSSDYKAWEAKFRCTNLKTFKKSSGGMASIDSSAPETTSSDNSPTLVRRNKSKHQGPGSDCSSSGKSSDSLGSSSSGDKGLAGKLRDNESPIGTFITGRMPTSHLVMDPRAPAICLKGGRHKNKNRMPTIPNQPSEAVAHFMFELAKTVLTKAGGNSSTSLFTQPTNNSAPSGPHRNLHLCAFQIGLYALGIHNCVSPNWLSRTYSSHVSWITGQAMEIGSAAVNILIDTWEGHLTPPEAANLSDRASRGRDPNMVRVAAELALACLPNAPSLNPNEIQRALIQCKEQSQSMLERACLAVENAAKDGGVYPEVLFDVARRWYELYEEAKQGHPLNQVDTRSSHQVVAAQHVDEMQAIVPVAVERHSPPVLQVLPFQQVPTSVSQSQAAIIRGQHPQPATVTIPYTLPPTAQAHQLYPYVSAYSYVQLPAFGPQPSQPHIQLPAQVHPAYVAATYPYQNQTHFNTMQGIPANATIYRANPTHLRAAVPTLVHAGPNMQAARVITMPTMEQAVMDASHAEAQQVSSDNLHSVNSVQSKYLLATYRVGMLAMETLARRVHDDRPQAKYARNPPYGEDVKWLLAINKKLGTHYLSQFCASAVNAVVSPFILHEITIDVARFLARNNPTQVTSQLRSPIISPVLQKCLQMFVTCCHQRISHITQADYDDFVSLVCIARNAHCMATGGMVQFNDLLQNLRRSKFCKKDLWQRIVNGLATGNIS